MTMHLTFIAGVITGLIISVLFVVGFAIIIVKQVKDEEDEIYKNNSGRNKKEDQADIS